MNRFHNIWPISFSISDLHTPISSLKMFHISTSLFHFFPLHLKNESPFSLSWSSFKTPFEIFSLTPSPESLFIFCSKNLFLRAHCNQDFCPGRLESLLNSFPSFSFFIEGLIFTHYSLLLLLSFFLNVLMYWLKEKTKNLRSCNYEWSKSSLIGFDLILRQVFFFQTFKRIIMNYWKRWTVYLKGCYHC